MLCMSTRRPQLDAVEERAMQALGLALCLRQMTDAAAGAEIGETHNWVNSRKVGGTRIRPGDMELLGRALRVPADLFRWDRSTILRWFAEEAEMALSGASTQGSPQNACFTVAKAA